MLWGYQCEASEGRNISCVEWNPEDRDMLAVGYGEYDFSKQRPGLVLFWSLKNPVFPDKILKMPGTFARIQAVLFGRAQPRRTFIAAALCTDNSSGVMALSFSVHHPYLLAVGLYDGTVCIFDVRKQDSKPILESAHSSGGKHTDPVWQLAWVDQGAERGEVLVSISTDGRVIQWNMKKGLEHVPLMNLKRVAAPSSGKEGAASGSEGIISRRASSLCLAFSYSDSNIYLAGTEDGHIHKCSCSYNEQYLDNYFGHAGPVYKLRWSPFCENIFLSCSADWSIKLWNQVHDFKSSVGLHHFCLSHLLNLCISSKSPRNCLLMELSQDFHTLRSGRTQSSPSPPLLTTWPIYVGRPTILRFLLQ